MADMLDANDDARSEASDISDHYLGVNPALAHERPDTWQQLSRPNSFKRATMAENVELEEAYEGAYTTVASLNPDFYQMPYGTRVINIKTDFAENVTFSVKLGSWSTLEKVSERIMQIWDAKGNGKEQILFLFAVNGTKQFCGLARMTGPWKSGDNIDGWKEGTSGAGSVGSIPINWIYVKNVPYGRFQDIHQTRNRQSVINMWNGMHFETDAGREVIERYVKAPHISNILAWPKGARPETGDFGWQLGGQDQRQNRDTRNGAGFRGGHGGGHATRPGFGNRRPGAPAALDLPNWRNNENVPAPPTARCAEPANIFERMENLAEDVNGLGIDNVQEPPRLDGTAEATGAPRPGDVVECVLDANGNYVPVNSIRQQQSQPNLRGHTLTPKNLRTFERRMGKYGRTPSLHAKLDDRADPNRPSLDVTLDDNGRRINLNLDRLPGFLRQRGAPHDDGGMLIRSDDHVDPRMTRWMGDQFGPPGPPPPYQPPYSAGAMSNGLNGNPPFPLHHAASNASLRSAHPGPMPNSSPLPQGGFPQALQPRQNNSQGSRGSSLQGAVNAPEFIPSVARQPMLHHTRSAMELSPTHQARRTQASVGPSFATSVLGSRGRPISYMDLYSPVGSDGGSMSTEPTIFRSTNSMAGVPTSRSRMMLQQTRHAHPPYVTNPDEESPTHQPRPAQDKQKANADQTPTRPSFVPDEVDEHGIPLHIQVTVYELVAQVSDLNKQLARMNVAEDEGAYYRMKAKKAEVDQKLFELVRQYLTRQSAANRHPEQISEENVKAEVANIMTDAEAAALYTEQRCISPVRRSDGEPLYSQSQSMFWKGFDVYQRRVEIERSVELEEKAQLERGPETTQIADATQTASHERAESVVSQWNLDLYPHANIDALLGSPTRREAHYRRFADLDLPDDESVVTNPFANDEGNGGARLDD